MREKKFGTMSTGEEVKLITLENENGMEVTLTDCGAAIVSVLVPDKNGELVDVVCGYKTVEEYEKNPVNFGACIGRNGNRIGKAEFTINGKKYQLAKNDHGHNNLHSNPDGYCHRHWNYETEKTEDGESVTFYINSPDGDQGFPGALDVEVTYTLSPENELMLEYYGLSDQDTVFNMTNHTYFNLNGHGSGTVLNHKLQLKSDGYCRTDEEQITTGEIVPVEGTPFDFREFHTLGERISEDNEDLRIGGGYDHNYVVNGEKVQENAELIGTFVGDKTGIVMEMYTDLPGVQVYSANKTNYTDGKDGATYGKNCACCFETQFAPNAINLPDNFTSPILKAGEEMVTLTVYRFLSEE